MKRIAINARLLVPEKLDGIGWFMHETIRRMAASHPECEFHLLLDRAPDPSLLSSPNIRLHRVMPPARRPILFRIWLDWAIPFTLRRLKADVFLSPDGLGSRFSPCPQAVVIHDINFEVHPQDLPPSYARYLSTTTRDITRLADGLATVSHFSRSELSRIYRIREDSIAIIPNACSEIFRPSTDEERTQAREKYCMGMKYFIFVSSIHPRKNLPRLLEAFDQFSGYHGEKMGLLVVGKPFWMEEQFRDVLGSMRHRDRVFFSGRLSRAELALALGGAEALAYVSYYEGFGIPLLEAFRAGVPVVAADAAALPEVAGGAALLVNPFDVSSIASGLSRIVQDPLLRQKLIGMGHAREKEFSWSRSAQLLWRFTEDTFRSSHAHPPNSPGPGSRL